MARPTKEELERRARQHEAEVHERAMNMVKEMMPSIISGVVGQIHANPALGQAAASGQPMDFESLATAMVRASNPKNRTSAVDPAILKRRKEHYAAMVALIEKAKAEKVTPVYKLRGKTQLNVQLIDPQWQNPGTKKVEDTEINWDRVPNEAMIPVNDVAKAIWSEYKGWIGRATSREGMPPAPWMTSAPLWVHGQEGIIRGKEPAVPEMPSGEDDMFEDPRRTGRPRKKQGTRVLGSLHPPLVETNTGFGG